MELDLTRLELPARRTEVKRQPRHGRGAACASRTACASRPRRTLGVGEADCPQRAEQGTDLGLDHAAAASGRRELVVNADLGVGHLADRPPAGSPLRMKRGRADRTLIVAGLVTVALGTLLLLDRTGTIDVQFNYMLPAVLAAIGSCSSRRGWANEPPRPSRCAAHPPRATSAASAPASPPASGSIRS